MQIIRVQFTGKKAKPGGITFDRNGHMGIFVDYCPQCHGKVIMEREEAEQFANKYHYENKRISSKLFRHGVDKRTH